MCAHLKGWVMEIGSQGKDSERVLELACRPQRLRCEGAGRRSPGSTWSLKFTPKWVSATLVFGVFGNTFSSHIYTKLFCFQKRQKQLVFGEFWKQICTYSCMAAQAHIKGRRMKWPHTNLFEMCQVCLFLKVTWWKVSTVSRFLTSEQKCVNHLQRV